MRILFVLFLLGLVFYLAIPVSAAGDGIELQKISLTSKWAPERGFQSGLRFNADMRWNGFNSRITANLRSPNDDDGYSGCTLGLTFPKLAAHLKFNTSYQWNEAYRIFSSGAVYQFRFWKNAVFHCGYTAGRRDAVPGRDNQYLYFSNRGNLEFDYRLSRLNYGLNYTYTGKNYPYASRYSSEQQHLAQKVTWLLAPGSNITLGYDESAGNYPYDTSYFYSYWKAAWKLKGDCRINRDFQWKWEYSHMEMDQSRERKRRNQKLMQKIIRRFETFQLSGEMIFAEKIYNADVFYDPGETGDDPYDDPQSRMGRKITIQYRREWEKFSLELGVYGEWLDYYQNNEQDGFFSGLQGSLSWKANDWRFTVKVSPLGDLRGNLMYYQLRLDYIPL